MDLQGKILLKYVCFGVHWCRTQKWKLSWHSTDNSYHVEENGLGVESSKRSWSKEHFGVLGTCIGLSLWMKVIHHKC